jgi:hypothetical protein
MSLFGICWFSPLGASVAEVPLDDRDLTFMFRARSNDFQEVSVNGVVTYRVRDPEQLAARVDFSLDTRTGGYTQDPIDKLTLVVNELAQQLAATSVARLPLTALLAEGVAMLRDRIHEGLVADATLAGLGVDRRCACVNVRPPPTWRRRCRCPRAKRSRCRRGHVQSPRAGGGQERASRKTSWPTRSSWRAARRRDA